MRAVSSRWNLIMRVGCWTASMLLWATPAARAATGTWTNTAPGTVANWTTSANWSGATYPGSGSGENASLTATTVSVYKAVLNSSLPNPLSTLAISNNAVGGTAWVIVTNAALSDATLTVGTGGGLEIDSGGLVSNTFAATLTGVGGQVLVANGGTFSSIGISNIANNTSVQVFTGGVWNLQNGILHVGNGGVTARTNSIVVNGGMLTNVGSVNLGDGFNFGAAHQNTLVVTNGGLLFTGPATLGYKTISNTVTVAGNGSLWNGGNGDVTIGMKGASYNGVLVTGGAIATNLGVLHVGNGTSGLQFSNTLAVLDGASLFSGNVQVGDGNSTLSISNCYIVGGSGAACTVVHGLVTVGMTGGNNALLATNASIRSAGLTIGAGTSANSVLVRANVLWNLGGGALTWSSGGGNGNQFAFASDAQLTNIGGVSLGDIGTSMTLAHQNLSSGGALNIGTTAGQGGNTLTISNQTYTATAASTLGAGSSNNALTVGGGVVWNNGAQTLTVGNGMATGNVLWLDGGALVTNATTLSVGVAGGCGNSVTVGNGAQYFGTYLNVGNAAGASSNVVRFGTAGARSSVQIWGSTGNELIIGGAGGGNNSLILTNATLTTTTANVGKYIGNSASNNSASVLAGGLWNLNVRPLTVGNNGGVNNLMTVNGGGVSAGAVVSNANTVTVGSSASSNQLTVINGGRWTQGSMYIGTGGGTGNVVLVDGGIIDNIGTLYFASSLGASFNSLVITNGGQFWTGNVGGGTTGWTIGYTNAVGNIVRIVAGGVFGNTKNVAATLGNGPFCMSNSVIADRGGVFTNNSVVQIGVGGAQFDSLIATNGGIAVMSTLTVSADATSSNNSAIVTSGGLLEANTLQMTAGSAGNVITNDNGIYQFTASPTLSPNGAGTIALNNGTVSFRGFSTADVLCNQSTKPLDSASKMAWSGTNAFRLNNATNNTTGQTYTFGPGMGATNFVRLELVNGSTYRGGSVTIANGGALFVSNGVSAVTNITFQSGSSLNMALGTTNNDCQLRLIGTAALGGTLAVTFTTKPGPGDTFTVASKTSAGSFSGSFATVQGFWQGAPYLVAASYPGNTSVVIRATAGLQGTAVLFR